MKLGQRFQRMMIGITMATAMMITSLGTVHAEAVKLREENIRFQSGEVMLEGTVLLPNTSGQHPAVVLVHGSNSSDREKYREEAEMFAKAGIAALIYDKRADGFSKSRAGGRSYSLLAEDVNAAAAALSSRADIDRKAIGLWGISEGAWVASLAAVQPNTTASFLITVGAVGVMPVQQQSWQLINRLYDQGVSSASMLRSVTRHGLQLAVSAGLFAEATYNPVPVFEQLKQPVLAIWGGSDRVEPAMESSSIVQEALQHGGNEHYTIRFFPNAGHLLRVSPDGIKQSDAFPPDYSEAMTAWVMQVAQGQAPKSSVIGPVPSQEHLSPAGIGQLTWYNSAWVQLGSALILIAVFAAYLIKLVVRLIRKKGSEQHSGLGSRYKLVLAAGACVSLIGFIGYFGFLMSSGAKHLAPVWLDRTLIWFLLQAAALSAVVSAILLVRLSWLSRRNVASRERVETVILLAGAGLFLPWALYWQLLMP